MESVERAFIKLKKYIESENYTGWDPYDGLNSRLFQLLFLSRFRFFRLAWIQLFKRLPINLRKLALVPKGENPKGVALILSGYCNLYEKSPTECLLKKVNELAQRLIQNQSIGFAGACWGYNFDWQAKAFFQPKEHPTVVATSFCVQALIQAYKITGVEEYLSIVLSSKNYILHDLNRTEKEGGVCLSYSSTDNTEVYNASLLGARMLSQLYEFDKDDEVLFLIKRIANYTINVQQNNGSWFYSPLPHHQWVDSFHTGFNLECLVEINSILQDVKIEETITKGLNYYLKSFFTEKGESKYYNNQLYPIDLHAPAQLVVTLYKTGRAEEYKGLLDRVLSWAILNMQSKHGYFYYQKHKYYINKNNYMRWTQAWMFYSLSFLESE